MSGKEGRGDVYSDRKDSTFLDRQKVLMGERFAAGLSYMVESPWLSDEKMKWALAMTTPPDDASELKLIFNDINEYLDGKKFDAQNRKITDPYKDPMFRRKFRDYLLRAYSALTPTYDSVTQVAMRQYMLPEGKIRFEMTKPELFSVWHGYPKSEAGLLCLITGNKGSGKTSIALKTIEYELERGTPVNSNIEMKEPVKNYTYCRRFTEMIKAICISDIAGKISLSALDETLLQFASFSGTTKDWRQMDSFCVLTRKLGNNQEWIAQYEKKIPEVFMEHYDAWIRKESKKKMRYEIKQGEYAGIYEIAGVEDTSLPFISKHISGMLVDVSIKEILEFLDTLPPNANQSVEMLRFIEAKEKNGWEYLTEWQKSLLAPYLMKMIPEMPNYQGAPQEDVIEGVSALLEAPKKKVFVWLEKYGLETRMEKIEDMDAVFDVEST